MYLTDPMLPKQFLVKRKVNENKDTFTLTLEPLEEKDFIYSPGQFNMLYMFGLGEVAISISGNSEKPLPLIHTIRAVGTTTKAMQKLKRGDVIGLRGPFGSSWPINEAKGKDVIIVVGGIGLAPLRPVIYYLLAHRAKYGKISLLYGARTPEDQIYLNELKTWQEKLDLYTIVDRANKKWRGDVGVVTRLIPKAKFDPNNALAMICGPEVMMRFVSLALLDQGLDSQQIFVSMERNMKCAIGFCGHCQLGGTFICKDGPVFTYQEMQRYLELREV
jgi:NAD(P)H-flavin reductase